MARVSYLEAQSHPELADLAKRIKGARGSLLNIYRMLLHSPPLAESWFEHINATRRTRLEGRLRELAILRAAVALGYAYALQQHVPVIATAEGITDAECSALAAWRSSDLFGDRERALLAYVDAMIAAPEVADDAFAPLRRHFDNQEILEITVIVGTYLMHHRVATALRLDLEADAVR